MSAAPVTAASSCALSMQRRGLLGAIAGVPLAATFGTIPLPVVGADPLFAELDAIDGEMRRLNALPYHGREAEWEAAEERERRAYDHIESLPHSPENAKLKARAVMSIVQGDVSMVNEGQSTVCRLLQHIVTCLAGEGR